jgi:hypothetical protein
MRNAILEHQMYASRRALLGHRSENDERQAVEPRRRNFPQSDDIGSPGPSSLNFLFLLKYLDN